MHAHQPTTRLQLPDHAKTWERFAQEDPCHYILTSLTSSDAPEFWRSGARTVEREFLPLLQVHEISPRVCLEVGCGIGRLAVPLTGHFEQVLGVDISPSMVQHARSYSRLHGIEGVSYTTVGGPDDLLDALRPYLGRCDFIYSLLVFQHIPDFCVIERYLCAIRALLQRRGLAYLQFDTRPQNLAYRVKTSLPDFLLPRHWRRGIRRIRRSTGQVEYAIRAARLEIIGELTPHTAYHRYILRLPQALTQVS